MLLEKPINIFLKNIYINFKFLLIWANENWTRRWDGLEAEVLIKQEYKQNDPKNFIKDIKKYISDKRYITINKKPVIGLYEPKKIPHLKSTITIWREYSREIGIGEIFILISINNRNVEDLQNLNLFDASYEFPPRNYYNKDRILKKKTHIYSLLLYKSRDFNEMNLNLTKFPFFRGTMLEWDNCPRKKKCVIFEHYSPEQFYIFNKIIIDWTRKHYNQDIRFIFINAWNEWGEGTYLEPDEKYGYASINSLSKAIFNLSYIEKHIKIGSIKIAVLAIINNEYSIKEIINKTNNIPYIVNTRENLSPLWSKFVNKIKNYKYICNLNPNNDKNITYHVKLKNYLYNNLLGNPKIITEIITDLEQNKKLGIIFPIKYYKSLINFGDDTNDFELKYLNFFIKMIYPQVNITHIITDFPEGNMFWAKISAIYQIFNLVSNIILNKKYLLIWKFYLEKIWLYVVNINGFLYKTIFKHL